MAASIANLAWPTALLAAVGMIGLGIVLLVWPKATLSVVAVLIGAALLVAGVFRLFEGITGAGESGGMRAADIVIGLLAVIAGLYCVRHHSLTILAVTLVVGVDLGHSRHRGPRHRRHHGPCARTGAQGADRDRRPGGRPGRLVLAEHLADPAAHGAGRVAAVLRPDAGRAGLQPAAGLQEPVPRRAGLPVV